MFEARLIQGQLLKKILDAVKDLVNEANWDCSPNGMSLQAMDTSHVSMVAAQLKSEAFDVYRCDKPLMLGMNLPNLSKFLKCAGSDDIITIRATDECDKITLLFEDKGGVKTSEYELKLINLDNEHLGIPEQEYTVDIDMPSSKFERICLDLNQFGDNVTISCVEDIVRFSISGDLGSGSVQFIQTDDASNPEEGVFIKMFEPISLSFSLKYLIQFSKAAPLSPRVKLSLKTDVPLVVSYGIQNEEDDEIVYIRYYLAPEMDEGDA